MYYWLYTGAVFDWLNHFMNKEIMYYYSRRTKQAVETASIHEPNRSMWLYDIHPVRRCSVQPPEAPRRTCNTSSASVRRPAVYCLLPLIILHADSPIAHLVLPDRLPSLLVLLLHSRPQPYHATFPSKNTCLPSAHRLNVPFCSVLNYGFEMSALQTTKSLQHLTVRTPDIRDYHCRGDTRSPKVTLLLQLHRLSY